MSVSGTDKNTAAWGDLGENAVAEYLLARHYDVLDRQWHCRYGELDLVAVSPDNILCFVEVKLRKTTASPYGLPRDAVSIRKRKRVQAAATWYFSRCGLDLPCRFDVAEVYTDWEHNVLDIVYIPDAFQ